MPLCRGRMCCLPSTSSSSSSTTFASLPSVRRSRFCDAYAIRRCAIIAETPTAASALQNDEVWHEEEVRHQHTGHLYLVQRLRTRERSRIQFNLDFLSSLCTYRWRPLLVLFILTCTPYTQHTQTHSFLLDILRSMCMYICIYG